MSGSRRDCAFHKMLILRSEPVLLKKLKIRSSIENIRLDRCAVELVGPRVYVFGITEAETRIGCCYCDLAKEKVWRNLDLPSLDLNDLSLNRSQTCTLTSDTILSFTTSSDEPRWIVWLFDPITISFSITETYGLCPPVRTEHTGELIEKSSEIVLEMGTAISMTYGALTSKR